MKHDYNFDNDIDAIKSELSAASEKQNGKNKTDPQISEDDLAELFSGLDKKSSVDDIKIDVDFFTQKSDREQTIQPSWVNPAELEPEIVKAAPLRAPAADTPPQPIAPEEKAAKVKKPSWQEIQEALSSKKERPAPESKPAAPVPANKPSAAPAPAKPIPGSKSVAPAPAKPAKETARRRPAPTGIQPPAKPYREKSGGALMGIAAAVFGVIAIFLLAWVLINVHPGGGSAATATGGTKLDLAGKLDEYMNNAASDALGNLTYVKKIYKISESDTVAPKPDESRYGTVEISKASAVLDVIQQARDYGLLEDQEVVFDSKTVFAPGSDIQYYCDSTILVICWKELIDGNTCSCVEVKVADASQFRRKIADDTYGSSNQYYASTMAKQVNSVVAMNADYYQFRNFGIVAYQRKLYRFGEFNYSGDYSGYNCIDNCYVTAKGEFLFTRMGDVTTAEEVQKYIDDNDILFSIAFGPVLVDKGVAQTCSWYPAGEPTSGYSRAGIGWVDDLHYFYMSLNHSSDKAARWTVDTFAQRMAEKGVYNAYGLDGGQTSEIVFQGVPYNYIDFGAERLVSDIIYFATAVPNKEVG